MRAHDEAPLPHPLSIVRRSRPRPGQAAHHQDPREARAHARDALADAGALHGDRGEFATAIEMFTRGLEIATSLGEWSLMGRHCGGIGACEASLGRHGEAIRWLEQAVRHAAKSGDKISEASARVNLSRVYETEWSHAMAVDHYDAGLRALEDILGSDSEITRRARPALALGGLSAM